MYGVFFGGFLVFKKETLVLKITYFKILLTKLDINGKEYFFPKDRENTEVSKKCGMGNKFRF